MTCFGGGMCSPRLVSGVEGNTLGSRVWRLVGGFLICGPFSYTRRLARERQSFHSAKEQACLHGILLVLNLVLWAFQKLYLVSPVLVVCSGPP